LVDVLMQRVLGSQPAVSTVDGDMHKTIGLGLGHLNTIVPNLFDPTMNYPVYIDDPLMVLSLSSLVKLVSSHIPPPMYSDS
jgi:hypothetical protein